MNRHFTSLLALPLLAMGFSVDAYAAGNPILDETFSFKLGGAYLSGSVDVGADLKGGTVAPDVSFDEIGIDGDKLSPYFNARWRFSDDFYAKFEYFGWDDEGSGFSSKDIEFGDIMIPAGVRVRGEMDVAIYAASLGWTFINEPRYELGVSVGLHIADLKSSIEGAGFVGGVPTPSARETIDATAPLPNLGLYGAYALSSNLALEGSVGYFSLSYGDYDGELLVAGAALEYRFSDNFGIGAGYTFMDIDLDVDRTRAKEHYAFELHGPVLFLTAGF
jgi:hypothetical protein